MLFSLWRIWLNDFFRAEYCRKTSYTSSNSSSQQRDPFTQIQSNNSCLRPQLPPTPTSASISADTDSTEVLLAACKVSFCSWLFPLFFLVKCFLYCCFFSPIKGKRWVTPALGQQHGGSFKFSYFERLTDDVVLRVFSFLSSSHLALCSRVCRRWHVLAWDPQLWSSIYLSGENLLTDRALKVWIFSILLNCLLIFRCNTCSPFKSRLVKNLKVS